MTETTESESSTRERILHLVVEAGPVSVLDLAHDLNLTSAGVRRHIAARAAAGPAPAPPARPPGPGGRGRPARRYIATQRAQATLDCTYAELAGQALAQLAEVAGEQAVDDFAERRAADLEQVLRPALVGADLRERTASLAHAFSDQGYAASVRSVPGGRAVQLCQGHCPVRDVAATYPALCEAETRMISRLLGVHVQRLSTLATGGHVCTTHVPVHVPGNSTGAALRPADPSGPHVVAEGER
ncbi:transcriptional regulator [Actinotalea sp. M2MS4P-6]|uniref:helix-turn-helix transcriptional regulator n=1 Tax=Actinotalea sp. M2MS4P-6 TaxID=2983762 RepID=UPI0021E43A3C|nr:transcriptional regulator [Actinotalea sp. M2MS4P-6]MCV2393356.1 transcriptional regulator [Actinotalea sp. M2MS4P-6]